MKKVLLILIVVIVVLLSLYIYFNNQPQQVTKYETQLSESDDALYRLYARPSSFVEGYELEKAGDFAAAAQKYEQSLSIAFTPAEEAHILYRLGRVYEQIDMQKAIMTFKEIVADENYPAFQKSYAALRLPLIMTHNGIDEEITETILQGDPYEEFRDDNRRTTLKKLFEFSISFGESNGVGDFETAAWYGERLIENETLTEDEKKSLLESIQKLIANGDAYIRENSDTLNNSSLIPAAQRARAKAFANLARYGEENALKMFDQVYEETIAATVPTQLDGVVRYEYFLYAYELKGVSSFAKTQKHIDILINNIGQYPGMKRYFEGNRNNGYGSKATMVELANANTNFKRYLLQRAGWNEEDFVTE